MSATVVAGRLLALASSAALNWGYLAQHAAASSLPPLTLRHPLRSLWSLFSNLRWTIGFFAGIGGWVLYVAALALAPLSLVQACSAAGIGLLALLVNRGQAAGLHRREWLAVWVSMAGLVLLGVSLVGGSAAGHVTSWLPVAVWIAISLAVAGIAAGPGSAMLASGAGLGIAAGVLYAAGDVGTKAAVHGHGYLFFVPVLLACHGLAFVALQLGFQRGKALATAGLAVLLTNALPIGAGVLLFHESLPGGLFGVLRVAAFACVVAGATLLARPEEEAVLEAQPAAADRLVAETLPPERVTRSDMPKQSLNGPSASVSSADPAATT